MDIKNYMELYQYVLKIAAGHSCNYLFADEIQEIEDFQLCLRSLLNENRCDIYFEDLDYLKCFCVKMYILSIKMCKEHEEGIVYLCRVGKWIP